MQKTAHVYQASELSATVIEPASDATTTPEPQPQLLKAETKAVTETTAFPYPALTQEDPTKQPVPEVKKTGTKPKVPTVAPKPPVQQCDGSRLKLACPPPAADNDACENDISNQTTSVFSMVRVLGIGISLDHDDNRDDCE